MKLRSFWEMIRALCSCICPAYSTHMVGYAAGNIRYQGYSSMGVTGIRVFVTDGYWRKTLAAVRGLGRMGMQVTVAESTFLAPALFSRHCRRRVRTPSPVLHPARYVAFLIDYLKRHPHDVLLPMEEETVLLLAQNRCHLEGLTRLPVADYACLSLARDKLQVTKLAESLGVPIPKTFAIGTLEEGMALCDDLPYPVVVKPRVGSGSAGIQYVYFREQLPAALKCAFLAGHAPLVQEKLPAEGTGLGVSLLLDGHHDVRASFVHRRLREYPVTGGPSTLRESCLHGQALHDAIRLMKSLSFVGVAMVEFKVDPRDGKAKLLEVNPRFWGSLALAVNAGVNFPYLLTLMALERPFLPVTRYRLGHRCRWLLPGDMLHFLHNPDRFRLNPGFFHFRDPDTSYDIIDLRDPLPVLGAILAVLPFYCTRDFAHVRMRSMG